MINIKLSSFVGSFAENKDIAQSLRKDEIIPALNKKEDVVLDFGGIEATTQSFVHALISDLFRNYDNILDKISFKNCNETVKKIIEIVIDYMQES
jgi:hypothetical protein